MQVNDCIDLIYIVFLSANQLPQEEMFQCKSAAVN